MQYFSLDTNLVLALINQTDRLHAVVVKLVKTEKKECVLCRAVLNESRKVAQEKINRAIVNSLDIIVDIRVLIDPKKRDAELKKRFKILMNKDPQLKNFYMFLRDKIVTYIQTIGVKSLPTYLSNLSEHVARILEPELKKILKYECIGVTLSNSDDVKRFHELRTCVSLIHFKDSMNYKIFCEIVFNLSMQCMVDFYTNDAEFSKKAKKAYGLLQKEMKFNHSWVDFIYYT